MLLMGLILVLGMGCPGIAAAQSVGWWDGLFEADPDEYAGTTTLDFLRLPVGARNHALGGRSLTTDREASAMHANPAALAHIPDYAYSVSHAEVLGEFRHEYLATTLPTRENGTFGFQANTLLTTPFRYARDIDEQPANPTAFDVALGMAYGRMLWEERLSVGLRADFIRSSIEEVAALGYALNLGVMMHLRGGFRLALALNNLAHGIRYDTPTAVREQLPKTIALEFGLPSTGLPLGFSLGTLRTGEGLQTVYGGAELNGWNTVFARAGYEHRFRSFGLDPETGLALGAGYRHGDLSFDYTFRSLGPLGNYHVLTLHFSRPGKGPLKDAELLRRAKSKLGEGRLKPALALAKKALRRNPENWNAVALINQIEQEMRRQDGSSFSVFYTANTLGKLTAQPVGDKTLGGLARRQTLLRDLQAHYRNAIFVDAGNVLPTTELEGFERYALEAVSRMPYDAINLGWGEARAGTGLIHSSAKAFELPWISANLHAPDSLQAWGISLVRTTRGGADVGLIGLVLPGEQALDPTQSWRLENAAAALHRTLASWKQKPEILVLLLHGTRAEAHRLASAVPELNAIVLSGTEPAWDTPVLAGGTLLLSPGPYGALVGQLTLTLDSKGSIQSYSHRLLPLGQDIEPDPTLQALLEPVVRSFEGMEAARSASPVEAQIFAFINSKQADAPGKLYLEDMKRNHAYHIGTGDKTARFPALNYGKSRVAYAVDSGATRELHTQLTKTRTGIRLTTMGGRVEKIAWSPGGNWLFFLYSNEDSSDVYRCGPTGEQMVNLTRGRFGRVSDFDVSPGEGRLVLETQDRNRRHIWLARPDGEPWLRVTEATSQGIRPRWALDAERLLYLRKVSDADAGHELSLYHTGTSSDTLLTSMGFVREAEWGDKGEWIVYSAGVNVPDLNLLDMREGSHRKLTTQKAQAVREERYPVVKHFGGRPGVLFEARSDQGSTIQWVDRQKGTEHTLVQLPGWNSLE